MPGVCVFFFFQAEDGIRDVAVTGVQTCALPILQPTLSPTMASSIPGSLTCRSPSRPRRSRDARSEEHTSELQSRLHLVCRLLLEKKNERLGRREIGRAHV